MFSHVINQIDVPNIYITIFLNKFERKNIFLFAMLITEISHFVQG